MSKNSGRRALWLAGASGALFLAALFTIGQRRRTESIQPPAPFPQSATEGATPGDRRPALAQAPGPLRPKPFPTPSDARKSAPAAMAPASPTDNPTPSPPLIGVDQVLAKLEP